MTCSITKITDYNYNLELFISQFQISTKLKGIIETANNSANDIEISLFEIKDEFNLDIAVGVQLDIIGIIFNLERAGMSDEFYRIAIKQKSSLAYSGEPDSIIEILKAIYEATYVEYYPSYPAKYYLITDAVVVSKTLEAISPAGVNGYIGVFILDGNGNNVLDGNDNYLITIIEITSSLVLDGNGNNVLDGNDNTISTYT